jgi:hypothetical protein
VPVIFALLATEPCIAALAPGRWPPCPINGKGTILTTAVHDAPHLNLYDEVSITRINNRVKPETARSGSLCLLRQGGGGEIVSTALGVPSVVRQCWLSGRADHNKDATLI